ncbi:MAG: hypothetical protein ALECFALPRED_004803 [Alectoria fallacina]|uniref:Chromate transporter n=1 Tax=Alectoria fallacina TaxID=1903189 RepID=A0A8H3EEF5_9LECA|nr:MAG: hypothetical protein ALECFALPRED_004803 [Alectoria fallacina]
MRIWSRYRDVVVANWHIGFTAFGGPAVQYQTFHEKFVTHLGWIDEAMYQQIFAISQALPGSASTKMLFCINTIHSGFLAGFLAFAFFCLPGALGMYSLGLGISKVGNTLPEPVYALLSGLNAATVGIIALAAVRLSERAITDRVTRFLVYLGGIMGMLYTAIWYYPIIMVGAGLTTLVWDLRYPQKVGKVFQRPKPRQDDKKRITSDDLEQGSWFDSSRSSTEYDKPLPPPPPAYSTRDSLSSEFAFRYPRPVPQPPTRYPPANPQHGDLTKKPQVSSTSDISSMSWPLGTAIIIFFLITFILTITLHAILRHTTQAFSLFSSLYLAGTIIFGGGPVVIPLLREYMVTPGWVSPRDFLLGLAVIQAFPGPNFNFAVYLGSLAVAGTPVPSYLGALIAFVAMYAPGLFVVVGFMGLWRILRDKAWFLATLRGVNAAAVGLVFTAVYKLWQIGCLTAAVQGGSPLGTDPWLVAITGTAFVGGAWFKMTPPVAILLGGAMGVARYGIVSR